MIEAAFWIYRLVKEAFKSRWVKTEGERDIEAEAADDAVKDDDALEKNDDEPHSLFYQETL